jgi:transposase
MTPEAGPRSSSGCETSRSRQSGSRRAAATSVVLHVRCSQQASRCARSIRSSCGSSQGRAGFWRKNDPLDARMIASFVGVMPTRPAQRPTPAAEQLAEMLAVRRQLSAEKVAAENASRLLEDAMLQRLSRRRIGRLAADIELLDERVVEIVATDAALAHRYRLLTSMPGVGPVLACTLIALLPELGGMTRKQVAAWSASRPTLSRAVRSREGGASGAVVRTSARCSTWRR